MPSRPASSASFSEDRRHSSSDRRCNTSACIALSICIYIITSRLERKNHGRWGKSIGAAGRASGAMPGLRRWRRSKPGLGIVERGALAAARRQDRLCRSGTRLPAAAIAGAEIIDCEGRWITPGLIDCHTHLVHAGNRANEFEMRLAGATYEEVARAGGGIVSSVKALRAASEDELVRQSLPRLDALIAEGVTTIEIKSGYGLDLENEAKSLRAARRLATSGRSRCARPSSARMRCRRKPRATRTPTSPRSSSEMLPAIAAEGLADAVDGFCEGIAFSPEQIDARVRRGQGARPAGEAACRPAFQSAWRRTRRPLSARCRPIISNIPTRMAPRRWPRPARSR